MILNESIVTEIMCKLSFKCKVKVWLWPDSLKTAFLLPYIKHRLSTTSNAYYYFGMHMLFQPRID